MARKQPTEQDNAALAAAVGRPRNVLVVGAGSGASAAAAVRAGAHVTGLESDPTLAARARRVLGEVIEVDPTNHARAKAALGERQFDLVLVPDLLQRAAEPGELLRAYVSCVEPEGRVILSLPNREAWTSRVGLETTDFEPQHDAQCCRHRFSRAEAARLAEAAGLEVLRVELNPLLLRATRSVLGDDFGLSLRPGEQSTTGYRDLSAYQLYLTAIRPWEVALASLAPRLLADQHVVVARRPPAAGGLSLTVGMLTMDEEPSVAHMLDEIRRYAPDARVLCVDSSVKDRTPTIAEQKGARVIRQLPPRGHGPAMELLMYEAARQSQALIYLDCDFTYPPEVIPALRKIIERGVDVVNAARTRSRPAAMPLPNYLANKSFVHCSRILNGVPLADLHSGMRAYRSSVIRGFAFDGTGDALPIDTLLWPARCGYRVVEVPIEYQQRVGISKLRRLAGTVWTFARLARSLTVGSRRRDNYEVWPGLEG
jgi:SAM-dependent methyltransferase